LKLETHVAYNMSILITTHFVSSCRSLANPDKNLFVHVNNNTWHSWHIHWTNSSPFATTEPKKYVFVQHRNVSNYSEL